MNTKNNNQSINNQSVMNNKVISTLNWNKIGGSVLHLFVYVALLTIISTVASAQCDEVSLACNNSINVSTNTACTAEVCTDLMLENMIAGYTEDDYSFSLTDEDDQPLAGVTDLGDSCYGLNETHVGVTIKASVTLDPCGVSCWGYINLEDKAGPRFLECVTGEEYGLGETDITCADFVAGVGVDEPLIAATCTAVTLSHSDEDSGVQCSGIYSGSIVRTWIAEDASGNTTTCQQKFNILKFSVSDVTFPEDTIHYLDVNCSIPDTSPESLGLPMGVQCPNIMYTFSDIHTNTCGAQQKFLRDWFVIDWCTGESVTDGQVIKIIDNLPPISVCPPDTLMYQAIGSSCSAKVVLDPFGVEDSISVPAFVSECSLPYSLVVEYLPATPGTNQPSVGPYLPVPMDSDSLFAIPQLVEEVVWVRYCFTDACGNGAQVQADGSIDDSDFVNCCFFEVQVSDNIRPTAICEGFTKVALGVDGSIDVFATTFDDHSYDACGSVTDFEARRVDRHSCGGGTSFGETVSFCCNDLGDTIEVLLKVLDDDGNSSLCTSRVCVTDPTEPVISCPANITIDCEDDYRDSSVTGSATGVDGCNVTFTVGRDSFDLKNYDVSCNIGSITRFIDINNFDGEVIKECVQTITVDATSDSAYLLNGDYTRPDNVVVDVCDAFSIHPNILGYPETDKSFGCINIGISWEDSNPVTSTQEGVCYTIVRTWLIVDWCRYNSTNPDANSIRFTQTITVTNSGLPVLECPDMQMVSTSDNTCRADIDLNIVVADACTTGSTVEWAIDADSDGTIDLTGTGDSASGNYPVGEHLITFTARNECQGAPSSCEFPFIIKGDRAPLPICLSSITWTLSENGVAVVWASDFNLKSEGGCDGTDSLTFSFVPPLDAEYPMNAMEFDCTDVPNGRTENISLQVFIVDETGNYESCTVILELQDSNGVCPDVGSRSAIVGDIKTTTNIAIENVMVYLDDMANHGDDMFMTDINGAYAFEDVDYNSDYMIQPEHDVDPLNGVSTLDLVKIQRHILGLELLDSPYKLIAADINNDGRITGVDLVQLQKMILGIFTEFPLNDSWNFVAAQHQFNDPTAPWDYAKNYTFEQLQVAEVEADFIAVKTGDVNESAINVSSISGRSNTNYYLSAVDQAFRAGDLVSAPFTIEEDGVFTGMQFTLNFDHENLVFQGIDGAAVNISEENYALLNNHNGVLTFSISNPNGLEFTEGETIFTAFFEAKEAGKLSEVVSIGSDVLASEVYTMNDEINRVEYIFRAEDTDQDASLELFQNQPNPFTDETSIAFYLPSSQQVKLTIFGAQGKVLWTEQAQFNEGINSFNVSADQLQSEGILLYRLDAENTSQTRKMIIIR